MRISQALLYGVAAATFTFVLTSTGTAAVQDEHSARAMPPPDDAKPDKQAEIASWPAEQQSAYAAWPAETQAYYWSLSPERQKMFWAIADSDKIALTGMTGPEREAAWEEIERAILGATGDA